MTTTRRARHELTIVSDTEIRITRDFDAPARLVFKATTTPEYMKRWYGCSEMEMTTCEIDLRPGGAFLWVLRDQDGSEYKFKGEYREVDPPHKVVFTEAFLMGDTWTNDAVNTVSMVEHDGKTSVTIGIEYASKADRDGHMGAGMETGMAQAHARLDALLAELVEAA